MKKHRLILKDKSVKLYPMGNYLEFALSGRRSVIAYKHIEALYLYAHANVSLHDLVTVAQKVPVYIIDRYGYIKAHIALEYGDETR